MEREIFLVGLNHRTAPVEVRERFALTQHCQPETWAMPCTGAIAEALILSTCNRVEILACGGEDVPNAVLDAWAGARGRSRKELEPYVYVHRGEAAVEHLFSVASSLDSMVLGEPQILGQLKDAYRKAVACKTMGAVSNKLLHKAFSVAKRVRTETAVASSAVSISYAAVELAKRIFGDMRDNAAMLVGAGEMAELAATHLMQAGVSNILVANRTRERGEELARQFHGTAIPFASLVQHLPDVDIVITSTGATEAILTARDIRDVLRRRKDKPMFFIDIAVPRDIDPDVNALDNVYLYDIDDLKEVVEENLASRRDEALKARELVQEEVRGFMGWLRSLEVQPTIVDLMQRTDAIVHEELERTYKRLGGVDAPTRAALEVMAASLARKLNHQPIDFLKHGGMGGEGQTTRICLVRRLFNLDNERPGRCPHALSRAMAEDD